MMLDESEEGAGEEDGEADGRTEKEREHGAGISAASGAAAGVDPPPPAPQATEQDDQPAAPRGRAVHHLFPKWRGDDPPTDLEEDLEAGFMGLPFNQPETEHEWEDQVNWDELERETVD